MSKPRSRVLAFMGFGKAEDPKKEDKPAEEAASDASAKDDDEEEEDEEDEDEKEAGASEEEREARHRRNALRAAGHRRGAASERVRIGAIVNGVDPAKAQFALHLALNTDMSPEQAKATLAAAPAGGKATPFVAAMAAVTEQHGKPGFGAGGPAKGASLSARMAQTLGLDKQRR